MLKVKVRIVSAYLQGYASQFLHGVTLSADALSAILSEGWPWSCKAEKQLREIQVMWWWTRPFCRWAPVLSFSLTATGVLKQKQKQPKILFSISKQLEVYIRSKIFMSAHSDEVHYIETAVFLLVFTFHSVFIIKSFRYQPEALIIRRSVISHSLWDICWMPPMC